MTKYIIKSFFVIAFFALLGMFAAIVPHVFAAPDSSAVNESSGNSYSANWAGYVSETGNSYTAVGGSWIVPTSPADDGLATEATWVGIGGVKESDLIQAGTQAIVEDGKVTYQAWYEMLPDYQQPIPLVIHGGDSVTVSLTETSPGTWHLSFLNNTTGGTYGTNLAYDSSNSSAEWIEERPALISGRGLSYLPLSDFGTVAFVDGFATMDGKRVNIKDSGAESLSMVTRLHGPLATPSELGADGAGFKIARADSASVAGLPAGVTLNSTSSNPDANPGDVVIVITPSNGNENNQNSVDLLQILLQLFGTSGGTI